MKIIFKYAKKYWYIALLAPIFMILEVLMDLELAQYMEKMIDYGVQTSNMDNIIKYGLIMVAILFVGVISGMLSGILSTNLSYKVGNDLRKDLFKKIMQLSYNQTDKFQTGSLVTRVTNDITQIQNFLNMVLRGIIRASSFFILGVIYTLSISIEFGKILLVALPIEIILLIIVIKIVFPIYGRIQTKLDRVNTVMLENVTGSRVVKAFSKEDYEFNRFRNSNDDYTNTNLYVSKITALLIPVLTLIVDVVQVIIYYSGGSSIIDAFNNYLNGEDAATATADMIMVGEITQAVTYIAYICMSILMLGMMFNNLAKAFASAKRVNEVFNTTSEIVDGNNNTKTDLKGDIVFDNVSFKYDLASQYVLNNINLHVKKGETVAIVGSTGCGKSSLINLIIRFFDTTSGNVLVDGINVKDYSLKELRSKIGVCLQKAELFKGTIADNIRFGKNDATIEEVLEAANIAQASEFIEDKEKKYDDIVEEKGTSLSGGQKQRLSIARAIIKKPEILIFDDSTSALDLITESKLYEQLSKHLSDTTKIVVAQRIATAMLADKIAVIDNSTIVAFDTHKNLLKSSLIYQNIYKSQMKEEN